MTPINLDVIMQVSDVKLEKSAISVTRSFFLHSNLFRASFFSLNLALYFFFFFLLLAVDMFV